MRFILPSLFLGVWCSATSLLAWQPTGEPPLHGDVLVQAAAHAVSQQPSLEAKVRQRASLFGQRASGAGVYLQLRHEDRTLVRYEFKLQVADQSNSLLHVNDGTTLWIRRERGPLQSQAYVNLRKVRDAQQLATAQVGTEEPAGEPVNARGAKPNPLSLELGLGGLGEILNNLSQFFEFQTPVPSELKGVPVWEVAGAWKTERLSQLPMTDRQLPEHLPEMVQLTLGRDQHFPLFPYRIEFGRRAIPANSETPSTPGSRGGEPLVTLEFFELRQRPDLTPRDFVFQPNDDNVDDITEKYVEKLRELRVER